jgi:hypothetical protein
LDSWVIVDYTGKIKVIHTFYGASMHFNILRTLPEMEAMVGEWNALLASSAIHVPFYAMNTFAW